ncbi:hypothetical protein SAMN04490356_8949 [Streptomyces melanosporofaciens]|uniref:Uncharacterized protein n=1 Tax=Streptomyces melanosporofaciens TaxID=67327 RepID=A0A1H5BMI1_STRMJ|nr:hypothetical protein [Streptomyces melanosporofaciens]SED55381.1 hypothetical protein SAMN04490356_8949 [Streptomyces melanosporofaciens]
MSLAQALNRSVSGFRGLRSTVGQTDTSVSRFARTATQAISAVGRVKGDVDKSANSMRTPRPDGTATGPSRPTPTGWPSRAALTAPSENARPKVPDRRAMSFGSTIGPTT